MGCYLGAEKKYYVSTETLKRGVFSFFVPRSCAQRCSETTYAAATFYSLLRAYLNFAAYPFANIATKDKQSKKKRLRKSLAQRIIVPNNRLLLPKAKSPELAVASRQIIGFYPSTGEAPPPPSRINCLKSNKKPNWGQALRR